MLKASIRADTPKMWQLTPPQARGQSERFFAPFNAGGPQMAEVRDIQVPGRRGLSSRLHVPLNAAATSPGLLYLHGGGFVIGSLSTHDRLARELAELLSARVLSLEHALAPHHPYPAVLGHCLYGVRGHSPSWARWTRGPPTRSCLPPRCGRPACGPS